jgi:hypothetical protein
MRVVAFDTETHLIQPGLLTPKLVCVSVADENGVWLHDRRYGTDYVEMLLGDPDVALVGHNVAYDLGVLCARRPELIPLVFQAYEQGRIWDTKVRQELLDIASGRSQRNGATFALRNGEWVKAGYSLAGLAGHYLGKDRFAEKTDENAWRMRYHELEDVPLDQWPVEATAYAKEDAEDTLAIFLKQGGVDGAVPTEQEQVRAAWALHLMSVWGVRTDATSVADLEQRLLTEQARLRKRVIQAGILVPKRVPEDEAEFHEEVTKRRKATKKDLQPALDGSTPEIEYEDGVPYVVTRTTVPMRWAKDSKKIEAYTQRYLTRRGMDVELTATGRVSTAKDTLKQTGSLLLDLVADGGGVDKVLGTYVPVLKDGTQRPINARFNVLVNSGRTSCVSGDTLVRTSTGYKPMLAVQIGDLVWTHKNRFRPVTRFLHQGIRDVVELTFSNGNVLVCTTDHRLLGSDGRWVTVEELVNEHQQEVGCGPRESGQGYKAVSRNVEDDAGNCGRASDDATQRRGGSRSVHPAAGKAAACVSSVSSVEGRQQESDEGQDSRAASQLARSGGRRLRLSDHPTRGEEAVRASDCDGSGTGVGGTARGPCGASHRWGQEEQQSGQSGLGHEARTSDDSHASEDNNRGVVLEACHHRGSHEVFDLTVLDDESYEAMGLFSHNCSLPNLQNLPSGRKVGGTRECFVPRDGYVFVSVDYDTLELRALAQVCLTLFGKSEMAASINNDRDLHSQVGATMLGMTYEDVEKGKKVKGSPAKTARDAAKVFNFGAPGGLGAASLVDYARAGYGVTINEQQAREMKAQWLKAWPEMVTYFEWVNHAVGLGEAVLRHPITGFVRGDVGYTDGCNHLFQHLAAQGAKRALFQAALEAYADPTSAFYGSRPVVFVHDEIIAEVPKDRAAAASARLAQIMCAKMAEIIPDVKITASPTLMRYWTKDAVETYDANGTLIPWEKTK